ncbi:probable inactive patatin-like protein 9 [Prosopis cineraria]|uniref:probable inactive patatin-like protein 9 n=1 Tax=Prosopis cineraria TaxID=364024 RepID=UPI00240EBEA9|nr:probable inactive patatin-like protein 9 [Prosopis cineraria]
MELSKVTLEIFSKLEQKWLSRCETTTKTRILSIDGGGTTAVVAGAALVRLEDQIRLQTRDTQAQIADFFDIIAGTGIGAILAAMITADDGSGRPLYTARDAVHVITQRNSELFKTKLPGVFRWHRRLSSKSMDKVLKEVFRSRRDGRFLTLKDACKPLLIPCFDLKSAAPFVFSWADASESPSFDFELWKVCRATSATPSLFKPFQLISVDGKTSCRAIDGGLVMNNPTAAAVTHVLHNKRDFPSVKGVGDLLVLSIGNGTSMIGGSGRKACEKEETLCSMLSMVEIVVEGVSETIDQMLGNAFCWNRTDYVRLQALGLGSGEELLKEKGVESLPFGGKRLLKETNGHRIDSFVQRLVASGKTDLPPPSAANASAVNPVGGS